ncbi:mCG1041446, partial [Mus musculus]
ETGFLCVALAVLELTACLCLPVLGLKAFATTSSFRVVSLLHYFFVKNSVI